MYIKSQGAYIALCNEYIILFRAVGQFPHFVIPGGIVLNDYSTTGEFKIVKSNDVEIQGIINNPERYAFVTLDSIADNFNNIDFKSTGKIEFDEDKLSVWIDRLIQIDRPNSGLSINSLLLDIVVKHQYSIPQARMVVQELRKKIKNESVKQKSILLQQY